MTTSTSTPTQSSYTSELATALSAVHLASLLTKSHLLSYQATQSKVSESTKADASEVTTADFAAQAVLISIIHAVFPDDVFIAEESGEMLREDEALRERVWRLVREFGMEGNGKEAGSLPRTKEEMVEIIDLGQKGGINRPNVSPRPVRTWALDPIDGTKTYIRGQQYAVCLSLIDDGEQKIGVLGCPNLNIETVDGNGRVVVEETIVEREVDGGWILSAVKGEGVYLSRMRDFTNRRRLEDVVSLGTTVLADEITSGVNGSKTSSEYGAQGEIELNFTDSSASSHTSKDLHNRVFEHFAHPELGSRKMSAPAVEEGFPSLALDVWSMQFKYVVLVLRAAGADAMIRVPPMSSYHACVWDHAGGQLLLTESGGTLTDATGRPFVVNGAMRKLDVNWGVCAIRGGAFFGRKGARLSGERVHRIVLEAVAVELEARQKNK